MGWQHRRENDNLDKNPVTIEDNTYTDQVIENSEQCTTFNEMSINSSFDQQGPNPAEETIDLEKDMSKQSQLPSRRQSSSSCNSGSTSDTSSSDSSGSNSSSSTSTSTSSSSSSSSSSNSILNTNSKLASVKNHSTPDKLKNMCTSIERTEPHSTIDGKGSTDPIQISSKMNNAAQIHNQSIDRCSEDNRTSQNPGHGPMSVPVINGNFR